MPSLQSALIGLPRPMNRDIPRAPIASELITHFTCLPCCLAWSRSCRAWQTKHLPFSPYRHVSHIDLQLTPRFAELCLSIHYRVVAGFLCFPLLNKAHTRLKKKPAIELYLVLFGNPPYIPSVFNASQQSHVAGARLRTAGCKSLAAVTVIGACAS